MKAVVRDTYGGPEVLHVEEIEKPTPAEGELLVKIKAASVNPADWHVLRGDPFLVRLIMTGFPKPKHRILGADVSGVVEAVGADVTSFKIGDEVIADLSADMFGSFAEYVAAPAASFALKPPTLTHTQAAALNMAATTALVALREGGDLSGKRVLVNGASGGIGSFAVQIAKARGAHVTGVCSTAKVDRVKSLGADAVVDYKTTDPVTLNETFDLIVDTAAFRNMKDFKPILADPGIYVMVGGDSFASAMVTSMLASTKTQKFKMLYSKAEAENLREVNDLVDQGKVTPLMDRTYPLEQTAEAIRYVEAGHAKGKVVVVVEE